MNSIRENITKHLGKITTPNENQRISKFLTTFIKSPLLICVKIKPAHFTSEFIVLSFSALVIRILKSAKSYV